MATNIFTAPVPARLPMAQKPLFPTVGVSKVGRRDSWSIVRAIFDKSMGSKHGRNASAPPFPMQGKLDMKTSIRLTAQCHGQGPVVDRRPPIGQFVFVASK
jgi:hypothetical protein